MFPLLRLQLLLLYAFSATALAAPTAAPAPAPPKAQPVAIAPPVAKAQPAAPLVAQPAFLDTVTFVAHTDGESHKLIVTSGPSSLRVDAADDGFSILYNPKTDHYTGLEQGNYTWWEFSWPEVQHAIESSKRYETRLQELSIEGISTDSLNTSTNAPTATALVPDDSSGYVWRQTNDKKRIAGFDCVHWIGETVSGPSVEAWCFSGPVPKLQAAIEQLRVINEPIALVPVRTLVPSIVFPIYNALVKGGVTPIVITWGGDRDKNSFTFVEAKTRDYKPELFSIPKLYIKTTLVTMDGMLDENGEKK